jgi:serine/threonine-protein kinase
MTEETIFQEALARSDADRARFLDQACSGQPQLRAAIEALLAAHQKPDNLLDNPPGNHAAIVDSQPAGEELAATGKHTPSALGSQDANVPLALTTEYRRDAVAGGHRRPLHAARKDR